MLFPRHILQASEPAPQDYAELTELCDALLNLCYDTIQDYETCSFETMNQNLIERTLSCKWCCNSSLIYLLKKTTHPARYGFSRPTLNLYLEALQPESPRLRKKMLFLTAAFCLREQYSYKITKAMLYSLTKPIGHTTLFWLI